MLAALSCCFVLFVYFWLCWVFVATHRLSLVTERWRLLFIVVYEPVMLVASLVAEHGL